MRRDPRRYGDFKRQMQYEWVISGTKAAELLKQLIPFLKGKKEQAELACRFQIHRKQGKPINQEFDLWCATQMKVLHKDYHICAAVETKQNDTPMGEAIVHPQGN